LGTLLLEFALMLVTAEKFPITEKLVCIYTYIYIYIFAALEIEFRAFCMVGKCSINEL
jgi:hypothetical protein